jgi:uncharacterized Ntn-hydrolase superfamily protein
MTYSIVAKDPQSGDLGVAVQTCWFNVGAVVPWAKPGVGAVATQSFTEAGYGPLGLELMAGGRSAEEALRGLVAADSDSPRRQVGMVDATGRAAAYTGSACVEAAGHTAGEGVTVQANMMERDTVWGAMLEAYSGASGDLVDRLLAALRAAEGEGGDIRGRQSAALLVVKGTGDVPSWHRVADLRVDDHDDPVSELDRLAMRWRAQIELEQGTEQASAGRLDLAAPMLQRAHELAPDDAQVAFVRGLIMTGAGDPVGGRALLESAVQANPRWRTYLRRIAAAGMFPNDEQLMEALLPLE